MSGAKLMESYAILWRPLTSVGGVSILALTGYGNGCGNGLVSGNEILPQPALRPRDTLARSPGRDHLPPHFSFPRVLFVCLSFGGLSWRASSPSTTLRGWLASPKPPCRGASTKKLTPLPRPG